MGEHLLCKQGVVGSIPSSSTKSHHRVANHSVKMALWFASLDIHVGCCSLTIRRVESALLAESLALVKGRLSTVPPATFDCVTKLQL